MEEGETNSAPSLEDLARRLHCPIDLLPEKPETSLSHIPWILEQVGPTGTKIDKSNADSKEEQQDTSPSFPAISYLDLRRRQNMAWANDRLQEGNKEIYSNPTKAETLYQQGLDMIPDHVDLLVAFGKLLANTKRRLSAISKFQRALELEPDHAGAMEQLKKVQLQQSLLVRKEGKRNNLPVARESSAYQDVLMERSLALDSLPLESDEAEDKTFDVDRKASSRKHKKHRKRRRKRKSYSDESSSSSEDQSSSDKASSEHARRKKRRKRKNHRASSSEDESSFSEEDHDDRKRRKRKHHRRKHNHKYHSKRKKRKREKGEHEL